MIIGGGRGFAGAQTCKVNKPYNKCYQHNEKSSTNN